MPQRLGDFMQESGHGGRDRKRSEVIIYLWYVEHGYRSSGSYGRRGREREREREIWVIIGIAGIIKGEGVSNGCE